MENSPKPDDKTELTRDQAVGEAGLRNIVYRSSKPELEKPVSPEPQAAKLHVGRAGLEELMSRNNQKSNKSGSQT